MINKKNNILKSRIPFNIVLFLDYLKLFVRFLTKRHKLVKPYNFEHPFFIIGSGRSGNTLLRSLLVAGNEVSIPPESYVWPRVYRRYRAMSFLPWDILSSIVVSEFEAYKEFYTWEMNLSKTHEEARNLPVNERSLSHIINIVYSNYTESHKLNTKRWGDKTPINTIFIDKIIKIFPQAQYIHIVRDPRDVVCSYVKAKLYSNYWEPLNFWKEANFKAESLRKKLSASNFYQIKYEDLVYSPEVELKKVCEFLKIDYNINMLNFWKNKNELGDVKFIQHHANIGSPISTSSIGNWKKMLTKEEISLIEEKAYKQLKQYSYL